jgi:hypothetical protein
MWDRTGQIVEGAYLGSIFYKGIVDSSRVTYGGTVQHDIALLEPIKVLGTMRDSIVVKESDFFVQVGEVIEVELEGQPA